MAQGVEQRERAPHDTHEVVCKEGQSKAGKLALRKNVQDEIGENDCPTIAIAPQKAVKK